MDDLTTRITTKLDQLERLARYSGGTGNWETREHPTAHGLWQVVEGTYDVATVKGSTRVQHITHWDPKAVLDLIAAHREILAWCQRANELLPGAGGLNVLRMLAKAHRIETPQ